MISDKLLINLKILSKIQKNGRISRSYDGIISLESDTYYQPVKRFISSDSRKQAVFEINSIITECIDTFSNILNSKYMNKMYSQTDEYIKGCENLTLLLEEFRLAKVGIDNLKFTYQNDPNVSSQLDIIILKMNTTLRDITQKLNHLQSFIPSNAFAVYNLYHAPDTTPQNQPEHDLHDVYVDNGDDSIQMNSQV
jgi:hypothetical protein